ncbi:MAG: hypothetical protein BGO70_14710 [Bacteroidetes bacterium 43-93]|nr:hypothetical protein [Bacteroidota bacterium]OJX01035.1 MAG: hypothetical protein BGO70_14710 [Bacteroidetes bacterium 43-93]
MTTKYKSLVAIAVLLSAFSFTSNAQFRLPKVIQRYEMGYSFVTASADYDGQRRSYTSADGGTITDEPFKTTVQTKAAYGFMIGTYFPIAHLGRASCLAVDVNLIDNILWWKNIGNDLFSAVGFNFSGVTGQIGVPVGLDFKFGCDATTSKNQRMCASLGAGVLPAYYVTAFDDNVGLNSAVSPYIKAEAGIRAGICFKIRMMYSFGNVPLITQDGGIKGNFNDVVSSFKLTGKSNVNFSLILMPFAWNWKTEGWWDRTQTSKKMY